MSDAQCPLDCGCRDCRTDRGCYIKSPLARLRQVSHYQTSVPGFGGSLCGSHRVDSGWVSSRAGSVRLEGSQQLHEFLRENLLIANLEVRPCLVKGNVLRSGAGANGPRISHLILVSHYFISPYKLLIYGGGNISAVSSLSPNTTKVCQSNGTILVPGFSCSWHEYGERRLDKPAGGAMNGDELYSKSCPDGLPRILLSVTFAKEVQDEITFSSCPQVAG